MGWKRINLVYPLVKIVCVVRYLVSGSYGSGGTAFCEVPGTAAPTWEKKNTRKSLGRLLLDLLYSTVRQSFYQYWYQVPGTVPGTRYCCLFTVSETGLLESTVPARTSTSIVKKNPARNARST